LLKIRQDLKFNLTPSFEFTWRYSIEGCLFIMIGIYKITSPNNEIYIGQSIDIQKRFKTYKLLHCKKQILLYLSFKKYGVENHLFEIICECDKEDLYNYERYYQLLYSSKGKNGLNCFIVGEKLFECKKELQRRKNVINIIDSILF